MIRLIKSLPNIGADQNGTMLIETALVAPVLVLLSLGAYQISGIVARQTELESAAAEGTAIALAAVPDTATKRETVREIMKASSGLADNKVQVTEAFRCNYNTVYVTSQTSCTSGYFSRYVKITMSDTYTPAWTEMGVGSPINYNVVRYVMIGQEKVT